VHDALAVEVGEALEDLGRVARDEELGELAELLDRLLERARLAVPARKRRVSRCRASRAHKERRGDALEDDVEEVLGPNGALVPDDTRVREAAQELDLAAQLLDLVLRLALEQDALDGDDLAVAEVERAVDGPELAAPDRLAKLLRARRLRQRRSARRVDV